MLTTLFKHEFKATARTFAWLYIAFAAIAILNAVMFLSNGGNVALVSQTGAAESAAAVFPAVMRVILMVMYGLSIAAISVVTLVVVILRFYRNLLGDEGYLMFTLPVSREQHILSKLFTAVIWVVCTSVLIVLSFMLLASGSGVLDEIAKGMNEAAAAGVPVDRWITMTVLALIVSSFSGTLMLYAAMAIGPNLLKNRVGGSILAFIIIYVVSQIASFAVVFGAVRTFFGLRSSYSVNVITGETVVVSGGKAMGGHGDPVVMTGQDIAGVDTIILSGILLSAAIGICCWFLTRYMLKKKLNLA